MDLYSLTQINNQSATFPSSIFNTYQHQQTQLEQHQQQQFSRSGYFTQPSAATLGLASAPGHLSNLLPSQRLSQSDIKITLRDVQPAAGTNKLLQSQYFDFSQVSKADTSPVYSGCSSTLPRARPQSSPSYWQNLSSYERPEAGPPLPPPPRRGSEWHHAQVLATNQIENRPVGKPWFIWCIGVLDILAATCYSGEMAMEIFSKPIKDPEESIWNFFMGFLGILLRYLQGLGLLVGIKSEDPSTTLWYSRFWVACQFMFICQSIISAVLLYIQYPKLTEELHVAIVKISIVLIYRVATFLLVRQFVSKLRKCESITWRNNLASGKICTCADKRDEDEENRTALGESTFCAPSVALIFSL